MDKNTQINVTNETALITINDLPSETKLLSEIFLKLADSSIFVDMISQTPPFSGNIRLSFTLPSDDVFRAMKVLNYLNNEYPDANIQVDANSTKISVYGEYMKTSTGTAAKLFKALSDTNICIKLITTSAVDISVLIFDKDEDAALEAINKSFDSICKF